MLDVIISQVKQKSNRPQGSDELYNANTPALLGNLDLDPEEVDTIELAFDYRPSFDSKIVLSLYDYKASDLIILIQDIDNGAKQKENAAQQDGYGFEIESQWQALEILPDKKLEKQISERFNRAKDISLQTQSLEEKKFREGISYSPI